MLFVVGGKLRQLVKGIDLPGGNIVKGGPDIAVPLGLIGDKGAGGMDDSRRDKPSGAGL